MTWRRQLAVASPISIRAVVAAAARTAFAPADVDDARRLIRDHFAASAVAATESGTSALVLALQATVPRGEVVGFPGYACVDLAAAALYAGVRVRLYDLDPVTLGPDLQSVEQLLRRGVTAIVVSHLFGYPADVPGVRALSSAAGVPLIEDAAQGASATLDGRRLGTFGDLSVLSFGRGKGLSAAGGGALLAFDDAWGEKVRRAQLSPGGKGWFALAVTVAQWALGRPSLYAIPSMIPGLQLGEMVYHPARDPAHMTRATAALLPSALALAPDALTIRRAHAAALDAVARAVPSLGLVRAMPGAQPGYLRYAVRDAGGRRDAVPALGILRSYPQTLAEQPPLAPILMAGEPATPGATELRQSVFTLPTHHFVKGSDVARIARWMEGERRPESEAGRAPG